MRDTIVCSICGGNIEFERLKLLSNYLKHRGPDSSGFFRYNNISLFHNRLAIIDLDSASNQPFVDDELVIVFNGEIYNYIELREILKNKYTFKTKSDTEVILKAYREWDKEALERFNGDFAFCILDTKRDILFCARDRLGNKPFYYFFDGNSFVFSSELFYLAKLLKCSFNEQKVGEAILFNLNDDTEETIFNGIKNLPPANYLIFDLKTKSIKIKTYWELPFIDNCEPFEIDAFKKAQDRLKELLFDAINIRLRSDVPTATLLSGGIDSSLLAYFISKIDSNHLFISSSFEDNPNIDESQNVNFIKDRLSLNVRFVKPSFLDLKNDLDKLILAQGDLFRSFSIYVQFCVFSELSKYSKVAISGQGADELFGGYFHHIALAITSDSLEYQKREKLVKEVAKKELTFGKKCLSANIEDFIKDNIFWANRLSEFLDFKPDFKSLLVKFPDSFQKSLYNDLLFANLPQLLRYEDRNAMHFSIENRTPFTDYRLVEFVNSLPKSYKFKDGYSKYILRSLLSQFKLDKIAWQTKKIAFEAPDTEWMRTLGLNSDSLVELRIFLYKRLHELFCA